jgi:hypothetical protein
MMYACKLPALETIRALKYTEFFTDLRVPTIFVGRFKMKTLKRGAQTIYKAKGHQSVTFIHFSAPPSRQAFNQLIDDLEALADMPE